MTYHNISVNKKGEWIGTPTRVERCVKDVILVDTALNDSILSPKIVEDNTSDDPEVSLAEASPGMDLTNRLDIPNTPEDTEGYDEKEITSKDTDEAGLPGPEATNYDRLEGHDAEKPETVTQVEVKPDQANPVRRSQRIKEKPGPALDLELMTRQTLIALKNNRLQILKIASYFSLGSYASRPNFIFFKILSFA